jgi:hypothetical protein
LILESLSFVLDLLFAVNCILKLLFKSSDLLVDKSDFLHNNGELFLFLLGESLSCIGSFLEWLDFLENSVVDNNVDNPTAKESSGSRFTFHCFEVEEWLGENWFNGFESPFLDIITVEGDDIINEFLWVTHHLLCLWPGVILFLTLLENKNSLCDNNASLWWRTKGFKLLNSFDLKAVNGISGSLHCWNSFTKLNISCGFLSFSSFSNFGDLFGLNGSFTGFFLGNNAFFSNDLNKLVSFFDFNTNIHHLDFKKFLKIIDLISG